MDADLLSTTGFLYCLGPGEEDMHPEGSGGPFYSLFCGTDWLWLHHVSEHFACKTFFIHFIMRNIAVIVHFLISLLSPVNCYLNS